MSRLFSKLLMAATLTVSLFATAAMADSIHMQAPGFTFGGGGGAGNTVTGGGGSGGGQQEIMNDDYYHAPKATDPGVKVNVLTAKDKPLDTSSYVAKDPGHKLNVLTAGDTPHHVKVVNRATDIGHDGEEDLQHNIFLAKQAALPVCGPKDDENSGKCTYPPSWNDCGIHMLTGLPCPKGWPKKPD